MALWQLEALWHAPASVGVTAVSNECGENKQITRWINGRWESSASAYTAGGNEAALAVIVTICWKPLFLCIAYCAQ
jgi:hypothetical protein